MNIREMHYDFKQKLNKIDSQQYRNLKVPEIDWKLNEAINLIVKVIAEPKIRETLAFEISQRVIDDIKSIVVNDEPLTVSKLDDKHYLAELPEDYLHYVGTANLGMKQNTCEVSAERIIVRQHDDDFTNSSFDKSSFIWREANIRFYDKGIKVFTEGVFDVTDFKLNYIKIPAVVQNAQDYPGGTYKALNGETYTGSQDCDLPADLHREIVDIAVAVTTGDLQIPDYQIKKDKLSYNQIG